MGLRINTNVGALTALRMLRQTGLQVNKSVERLATGLRINRASDDPSGMVIGQRLRAQVASIRQVIENSQNASNMINTADAALGEVSNLLIDIRESVLAAMAGEPETIAAEQDSVNNALSSINRIAQTTRFANQPLLNGGADFTIMSRSTGLTEINLNRVQFAGASSVDFAVNVTAAAEQATLSGLSLSGAMATSGAVIMEVRGSLGVETINIASGGTASAFTDAVNAVRGNTGVYASGTALYTEEYGTDATITVTQTGGTGTYTGQTGADTGVNAAAAVNGMTTTGTGRTLTVGSTTIAGDITLDPTVTAGTTLDFTVRDSGLTFQLGTEARASDQLTIGIQNMSTGNLGAPAETVGGETVGGFLNTLAAGGANDLYANPENALRIVDEAIDDVTNQRSSLGAVNAYTIEPNINSLEVAYEELSNSYSTIMDLDYAMEISNFIRNQVLMEAGIMVLGQSNSSPNMILDLLSSASVRR